MPKTSPENAALSQQVETLFDAVRKGNLEPITKFEGPGEQVVPLLTQYLEDTNPDVRREAVRLLNRIAGRERLPLLVRALGDPEREIQEAAAEGLYLHTPTADVRAIPGAETRAAASVAAGNHTAAAILLLGRFAGAESAQVLRALRAEGDGQLAKLHPWSPAVPVAVPAMVALSLRGDNAARQELLQTVRGGDPKVLEFLLSVLREIDAPEVIHALKGVLADERPTTAGVPSGGAPEVRLCDLAVTAFVRELDLDVDFETEDSEKYTPAQIDAVRRAVDASVPK